MCCRERNAVHNRKNSMDNDLYEPEEFCLQKAGLPEMFFCDPKYLNENDRSRYRVMAIGYGELTLNKKWSGRLEDNARYEVGR